MLSASHCPAAWASKPPIYVNSMASASYYLLATGVFAFTCRTCGQGVFFRLLSENEPFFYDGVLEQLEPQGPRRVALLPR